MSAETRPFLFSFLGIVTLCEIIILLGNPPPLKQQLQEIYPKGISFDHPLIVLHQGTSPNHNHVYNTAFWTGWGTENKNMKNNKIVKHLPWAAEGTRLTKSCDVSCYVSESNALLPVADAVMMEIINHERTFGSEPINWPTKRENQLWGMFFYEPYSHHSAFLTDDILDHFDFTVLSKQSSDLPITLICPWGRTNNAYLSPIPKKEYTICDYSAGFPHQYYEFLSGLREQISIDTYSGTFKNKEPISPFNLPTRLRELSQYKFAIVTETTIEEDWVGPEFSQVLLAGTIPIYLGATNIDDFIPGEKSIIKITDFNTPNELGEYLQFLLDNEDEYNSYFKWKNNGLSSTFTKHLNNCAHLAECRICHHILENQNKQQRELVIINTLSLPFTTGPYSIQAGSIDATNNKGYSMLNTTSGMIGVRFTLEPLSFATDDSSIITSTLKLFNGAIIDPESDILYYYGSNSNTSFGSVGGIESFSITNGTEFSSLSSYSDISTDKRGFLSSFIDTTTKYIYSILINNEQTVLFELNLLQKQSSVIHRKEMVSVFDEYYTFGCLLSSQGISEEIILSTAGNLTNPTSLVDVASFSPSYPWIIQRVNNIHTNATLHNINACDNIGLIISLITICDPNNDCNEIYFQIMDELLFEQTKVLLGSFSDVTTTSLTCYSSKIAIASINNQIFQINLETLFLDTTTLFSYSNIIWSNYNQETGYIYAGVNPKTNNAESVVLQIEKQ